MTYKSKNQKTKRCNDNQEVIVYNDDYYSSILSEHRIIMLYNTIEGGSAEYINAKLFGMAMESSDPIWLEINSPGGSITDGFAIIDTILNLKAPVITVVKGMACSMAFLIAIVGKQRQITENSYMMQHASSGMVGDYLQHIKDSTNFLVQLEKRTLNLMKEHAKLSKKDYAKIRNGELWLSAEDCIKRGVVDYIIKKDK